MPRNQTWRACGVQSAMAVLAIALAGCTGHTPDSGESRYDGLPRSEFNRWAVRENRSLYWIADSNHDGRIQPDEVTKLLFYPPDGPWVENGRFTGRFEAAYAALVTAAQAAAGGTPTSDERRKLVAEDLDQGRSSLVSTDFSGYRPGERNFVGHMLNVAAMVDALYDLQTGATAVAGLVPADDAASQSLFRRNHGPACLAPRTQNNPQCSAIPGAPKPRVDVYPAALQQDAKFCTALERRPDAERLLDQFSVVRERNGRLVAVPYSEAYAPQMDAIAGELERAASSLDPQAEAALIKYLRAAAGSFRSNAWIPADEAWASMNAVNSKWYVRVGPDEVYWDPCASKAGFHLTFALINSGSLSWQQKLGPHQAAMEAMIAERAGAPYRARRVSFHLPDFIDIIVNAGNDRDALGATIGQSLPNWGPVADQGRGRTVAMTNLYKDADNIESRHRQVASVFDAGTMLSYSDAAAPSLLTAILHEITHNLGPASDYRVHGRTDATVFGGPIASMLEELKAETGALFFLQYLRSQGLIDATAVANGYTEDIAWALGHISRGMYTGSGARAAYGNLAAIQVGLLLDAGALSWDADAVAADGKERGALIIHQEQMGPAVDAMMKQVAGIKARGDKAAALALIARYVDSSAVVPHAIISERMLREPKASFVYAVRN